MLTTLLALLIVGGAWELLGRRAPEILPSPTLLFEALTQPGPRTDPVARQVLPDLGTTMLRMLEGSLLGFVTGLLVGIGMAKSRLLRWAIQPHIALLNITPHIAVLPILVIVFGFGTLPTILLVWSGVFVIVALNTQIAIEAIDPTLRSRFHALRATRSRTLRHLYLPSLVPALLASARLAIGYAWALAILGETFGQQTGIGYLLVWYSQQGYLPGIFLLAVLIGAGALVLEMVIRVAETRLIQFSWR